MTAKKGPEFGYLTADHRTVHKFEDHGASTLCGEVETTADGVEDLEIDEDRRTSSGYEEWTFCKACFIHDPKFNSVLSKIAMDATTETMFRQVYALGLSASVRQGYCPPDPFDSESWWYGMPQLMKHLLSAQSHLSDFQDTTADQESADRVDGAKVVLHAEIERLWEIERTSKQEGP